MDLEVVGRHALLFDDDATAAFVNSPDALVDWNSLSIDRYDVRHLLSAPPPRPPRGRPRHSSSPNLDDITESDLDHERYLDLPSPTDEQDRENEEEQENVGGNNAVPFSYGNPSESTEQKNNGDEPGFRPPFSLPEHLLQNLPPTEKVHQIIARTAMFVSKHGGQTEIVLRVKQGDNPTFGFLMPDHVLHPYFRYLVDHQELLKSDIEGKALEEESKSELGTGGIGGALSLLGSVYGSGEDEEIATKNYPEFAKNDYEEAAIADNVAVSLGSRQTDSHVNVAGMDDTVSKHPVPSLKERAHVIRRNRSISTVKVGPTTGLLKEGDSLGLVSSSVNKVQASASSCMSKDETFILEPPSDMKRVIDKIVEFILRNGKEFEAVLVQQDIKHGRFPFLLPTNQYYPYYLRVLQKAQESRLAGKGIISERQDLMNKKTAFDESNTESLASDIQHDSERKGKFKMVIGKSKKDGQELSSKVTQPPAGVSVDAAAAAAILQAARKGIKNPNLDILHRKLMNDLSQGHSSEGGEPASSLLSSRSRSSIQNLDQDGEPGVSVPVAKAIAKTAAIAAAGEADSAEASLTREQQLKAERLRRAKMFAAMIKTGAAPLKSETLRGLSSEPPESGFSESGVEGLNLGGREREGSTLPSDINETADKIENSEKKVDANGHSERRSKRRYRSRSNRDGREEEQQEEEVEEMEEDSDYKQSRKKRRSHRSSHHVKDKHKHSKHSSSKDKDSRHRRKRHGTSDDEHSQSREQHNQHNSMDDEENQNSSSNDYHRRSSHRHKHDSSDEEHRQSKHRRKRDDLDGKHRRSRRRHKHDSSSDDEHKHSKHRHQHDGSSDDEHRHSRPRHNHDMLSDDEHQHLRYQQKYGTSSDDERGQQIKPVKYRMISQSEREADLEEGEILTKSDQSKASEGGDGANREASVDLSTSYQDLRAPSQPAETTEVSDDLRAKIRAMLMATL